MPRACPNCSQEMLVGTFGPLEIDVCRPCGGVWFDAGELNTVLAAGPPIVQRLYERIRPQHGGAVVKPTPTCPSCRIPLNGVEYGALRGIVLDACRFCEGFWVPHATLWKLVLALQGASEWHQIATQTSATNAPPASPALPPASAGPLYPPTGSQLPPVAPAAQPPRPVAQPPTSVPPPWAPTAPAKPAAPQPAPKPTAGVPATARCPHCGEPNSDRAPVCWACGKALQGKVVGTCPQCEAHMRRVESEQVAVNACEGCGGVWTQPLRLNQIILQPMAHRQQLVQNAAKFNHANIKRLHRDLDCPDCKQSLYPTRMGALTQREVMVCRGCTSLFLFQGTLEDILLGQGR